MTDVTKVPPTPSPAPAAALSRRGFVSLGIGALAVASLPIAMYRRKQVTRRSMPVMGTVADFVVLSNTPDIAQGALDAAMTELQRVEALMTRFSPTSDVGRVNRGAVGQAVRVSSDTAQVVAEAIEWAEASGGEFDPALATAAELWDFPHRHEPPASALIAPLAGRNLYRSIEVGISRGQPVIVRHDALARLDLGGIAAGYGVDRAAAALREWGIGNAIIDVGGDIYAVGRGLDGDGWRIGIRSPFSPDDIVQVFRVSDAAVATSGTYVQYFRYNGKRYHHLLDPSVAAPRATLVQSFTVEAPTCLHADAASTACFGMSGSLSSSVLGRRAPGSRVVSTI